MKEEDDPEVRTEFLKDIKGHIEFRDVSFSYEENKNVLHNITEVDLKTFLRVRDIYVHEN